MIPGEKIIAGCRGVNDDFGLSDDDRLSLALTGAAEAPVGPAAAIFWALA